MIEKGERVRVYRNLHKNMYSVQAKHRKPNGKPGWKVMEHRCMVGLRDVEFIVSEQGRQRVLREKRKNVHCFAVGHLDDVSFDEFDRWVQVSYNPYKVKTFVEYETGKPVHSAKAVILDDNFKVWVAR